MKKSYLVINAILHISYLGTMFYMLYVDIVFGNQILATPLIVSLIGIIVFLVLGGGSILFLIKGLFSEDKKTISLSVINLFFVASQSIMWKDEINLASLESYLYMVITVLFQMIIILKLRKEILK